MPNEQLAAYVQGEVAKGVGRGEIAKALLAAGWPADEVNTSLIALGVPMEGTTPTAGVPAPAAPSVPSIPQVTRLASPVAVPISPVSSYVPQSTMSISVDSGKFPGVFALVKSGIAIYRERFGTFIAISLIEAAIALACIVLFGVVAIGGVVAVAALGTGASKVALIAGGFVALIVIGLLFFWLLSWTALALLHAVRGAAEGIGVRESFRRARPQAWGLIWIGILCGLAFIGGLALFAFLPAGIIYFGGKLLLPGSVLVLIASVTVAVFASVAVAITFGTWFLFSGWVLADTDTRGTHAIIVSKRMVHEHFGAVFGRWIGLGLLVGLASLIINIVFGILSLFLPVSIRHDVVIFVDQFVTLLVIYPVLFGAMYSLYAAVKARTISVDATTGRGKLIALTIIGILFLISLPFIVVANIAYFLQGFASTYHPDSSMSAGTNDAIRQTDIAELQLYLELYYNQDNRYPATLSDLSTVSVNAATLTDPVTHAPFSYVTDAQGTSYQLCATLDSGASYCKQYPDTATSTESSTTSTGSTAASAGNTTLTVTGYSISNVTVFFKNMPSASVSIVRNADGKVLWQQQLGTGDGSVTVTPAAGTFVAGSAYHLEAHGATGTLYAESASFSPQ